MTRRLRLLAVILTGVFVFASAAQDQKYEVEIQKDVAYASTHERQKLDLYLPKGANGLRPGVVLVHGGGWRGGNKQSYASLGQQLAARGYVAIACNYRLAPEHPHPAQLDDVQRAVRWLRHNAKKYNVDPGRLGAHGGSAGGHLVLFLGSRETRDRGNDELSDYSSKVHCVVDYFGPSDFVTDPLSTNGAPIVESFIGKKRSEAPEAYRDASPITFVTKSSAPTLICHGTHDMLVPIVQSERMEMALKHAGVAVTLLRLEGQAHGFRDEAATRALEASIEFFDKHLKP